MVQILWETVWQFPKLNTELPHDPAIPLLGNIHKRFESIRTKTCTQMFLAALFRIAKKRKQLKYPSMDE